MRGILKELPVHFTPQNTYQCRDCGSRLIENGLCLTCDSVQIDIVKGDSHAKNS